MKMKLAIVLTMAGAACAAAQEPPNVIYQSGASVGISVSEKASQTPVLGAPYTATITNGNVQTLADGNRIVESSTGTMARDSQGRTRRDAPLPMIANMAVANAPHLVFINDPVAQKTYLLNLTDKTARTMSVGGPMTTGGNVVSGAAVADRGEGYVFHTQIAATPMPLPALSDSAGPGPEVMMQKMGSINEAGPGETEDLGTQTMEGVVVTGTRTSRTIPAGQIGNEKPITIVTEVWMSPELKTVVMSKRSDPRMGEQTFQLTNIVRAEPDPSLFTVPTDFKSIGGIDGPQTGNGGVTIRTKPE
jgi:hypothetical protein